jgi:subtilisin family serine protease
MWVNPIDHSHGLDAIAGTTDPSDDSGHGTMVAGILGAVGNNGIGIAGVAWQVQIMACKCFDKFGVGSISDCITCLEYARTNGARLINASWGFNTNSSAFSNALYSIRAAGVIVIAAAGNNASNIDVSPSYPSSYRFDNIVSVAYTTREDTLAAPSNYGSTNVQLAAPGEQIYSTFAATDSYYYTLSGSSFAAPYVTGTLALMLARYPAEPYQQIISRLLNATDPLPSLAGKCSTGGRLNLRNALDPPLRLKPVASPDPGLVQFRVVSAPNRTCAIQSSTGLGNWAPIFTNVTSAAGTFDFIEVLSTNLARRFYRAVSSP